MTPRGRHPLPPLPTWWAVALGVAGALIYRACAAPAAGADVAVQHGAIVGGIIAAISAVAGAIATAAEITVTYLAVVVQFLATRVFNLITSTGAMFAKVWDAAKIVWADVLRPALSWIEYQFTRVYFWLRDTLAPVFDWLERARVWLDDIYRRFIRPFVDFVNFVDLLTRTLDALHIHILDGLDRLLDNVRDWVLDKFRFVYQQLTWVWNWLDHVVTFDGYLQRLTLLASLGRHLPDWTRMFWTGQLDERVHHGDEYSRNRIYPVDGPDEFSGNLTRFLQDEDSTLLVRVPPLVRAWRVAVRLDPPGTDWERRA